MKPELLAPAGDLERLKVALLYGADAVYIGGTQFSLRFRASNFTLSEIAAGVKFAHALGKKVYVTANIVMHNDDLGGLDAYLSDLEKMGVDAVIASSPYVVDRAIQHPRLAIHLSTQQSVASSVLVNFWGKMGVSRVVLAREVSLEEIKMIKSATNVELEVFI
ncbi:MAG: peptidase U32 family protein, partial [Candidatus Izemoplasmatales bacterium]